MAAVFVVILPASADTDQTASATCGGHTVSYGFSRESCVLVKGFPTLAGDFRCVQAPGFDDKRCARNLRMRLQNQITGVVKKNDGTMTVWECEINDDGKRVCVEPGQTCENQDYLEATGAKKPTEPKEEAEGATGDQKTKPAGRSRSFRSSDGRRSGFRSESDSGFSVTLRSR